MTDMNYLDTAARTRIVAALVEGCIHQTLRVTPAMAAGVTDKLWDVGELVALLEQAEAQREAALGPRRTRGQRN